MMAIVGYTHTQASQDATGSSLPGKRQRRRFAGKRVLWRRNDEHIGAFAQVTYNGAPFGQQDPADPFATHQWTWDNTDIRYANTGTFAGLDVIFGITANNNPTVQDPWNTTPAWSFPYAVSSVAPTPGAGTLVDGTFAAGVAGAGAYAFINDLLYVELTGYRTVNFDTLNKLGQDPFGFPGTIDGIAPYWRVAVEPHWGNHWLEFGLWNVGAGTSVDIRDGFKRLLH